jgi:cytochrome c553
MKKLAFAVLCCFSLSLHAVGDIQAGQTKSAVCTACHGEKGISQNPEWPNLAGQHASYTLKQLKDFKAGKTRSNPNMDAILAGLNDQDMEDLAAYYASLPKAEGRTPKDALARGQALYRGGDFNKHITACIACHGPQGTGNAQAGFPSLSGQHAVYSEIQLKAFKDGLRRNDLNAIMRDISSRMDAEDMKAVAYYMQGLH